MLVWGGGSDDFHTGLRTNPLRKEQRAGIELVLGQAVLGKDSAIYSVHVRPSTFTSHGVETTDLLAALGFRWAENCKFIVGGAACRRVGDDFDLGAFAEALEKGYALLQQAGGHLEACGYEVVSAHNPKAKFIFARPIERVGGDGHTGAQEKPLKQTEDDMFRYVLTWIDGPSGRGWVTHYAPKQAPPPDVECLLAALDLHPMAECPEFNFEPCHWSLHPKPAGSRRGDPEDWAHTNLAHEHFDAHATRFSAGVTKLVEANAIFRPLGMELIPPLPTPPAPRTAPPRAPRRPANRRAAPPSAQHYHVAFSFAGTEREIVKRIVGLVEAAGYTVFYDEQWKANLWGEDLSVFLDGVYREHSDFCVVMASEEYLEREWPLRELQSAVARAIQEKGYAYLLPVRVGPVNLPGVSPIISYLDLADHTPEEIGALIVDKLEGRGILPPSRP